MLPSISACGQARTKLEYHPLTLARVMICLMVVHMTMGA